MRTNGGTLTSYFTNRIREHTHDSFVSCSDDTVSIDFNDSMTNTNTASFGYSASKKTTDLNENDSISNNKKKNNLTKIYYAILYAKTKLKKDLCNSMKTKRLAVYLIFCIRPSDEYFNNRRTRNNNKTNSC